MMAARFGPSWGLSIAQIVSQGPAFLPSLRVGLLPLRVLPVEIPCTDPFRAEGTHSWRRRSPSHPTSSRLPRSGPRAFERPGIRAGPSDQQECSDRRPRRSHRSGAPIPRPVSKNPPAAAEEDHQQDQQGGELQSWRRRVAFCSFSRMLETRKLGPISTGAIRARAATKINTLSTLHYL